MTRRIIKQRARLLRTLFIIIASAALGMSWYRFYQGDIRQCIADAVLSGTLLLLAYFLHKNTRYYIHIVRFSYLLTTVAALHAIFHLDGPMRFIWMSTILYFTFFIFDEKEAKRWIAAVFTVLIVIGTNYLETIGIRFIDYVVWMINIMFVLIISKWYLDLERASVQRMQNIELELRREVAKKTAELAQKSQSLEHLNQTLEKRIADKVAKIHEQEKMLFRQARYATMGETLDMIAHQWRQPLHAIAVTAYAIRKTLRQNNTLPSETSRLFERIDYYVHHLSETIDDFKQFFRSDKEATAITVEEIFNNVKVIMEPILVRYDITLTSSCPQPLNIRTYPNEVLHAILNIVRNAQDALTQLGHKNPTIHMTAEKSDTRSVTICIEDNAGGIDPAIADRIFEPYVSTKGEKGLGLGLYMTKIIIEEHCKGHIRFETDKTGTKFYITLPLDIKTHPTD